MSTNVQNEQKEQTFFDGKFILHSIFCLIMSGFMVGACFWSLIRNSDSNSDVSIFLSCIGNLNNNNNSSTTTTTQAAQQQVSTTTCTSLSLCQVHTVIRVFAIITICSAALSFLFVISRIKTRLQLKFCVSSENNEDEEELTEKQIIQRKFSAEIFFGSATSAVFYMTIIASIITSSVTVRMWFDDNCLSSQNGNMKVAGGFNLYFGFYSLVVVFMFGVLSVLLQPGFDENLDLLLGKKKHFIIDDVKNENEQFSTQQQHFHKVKEDDDEEEEEEQEEEEEETKIPTDEEQDEYQDLSNATMPHPAHCGNVFSLAHSNDFDVHEEDAVAADNKNQFQYDETPPSADARRVGVTKIKIRTLKATKKSSTTTNSAVSTQQQQQQDEQQDKDYVEVDDLN